MTATLLASFTSFELPATAFSIAPTSNSTTLINALLGNTTGLSDFQVTTVGDTRSFGTFTEGSDPFAMDSGVVLSTGRVSQLPGTNTLSAGLFPDLSSDLSVNDPSTGHDITRMDITFFADSTAEKLFFNFVFGSEEFLEYGGSRYNDSFELLLNGINLAKLTDGQLVTINNLVPDPAGPYHPDYIDNPAGAGTLTRLDGFTTVLGFKGGLNQNATNTLSIVIKDISDSRYDSAVFIQGGSLGTAPPPKTIEPAPTTDPNPNPDPTPEPVASAPDPIATNPDPTPEPVASAPDPIVINPEPTPELVASAPSPIVTNPEPTPEPVMNTPSPAVTDSEPTPEPVASAPNPAVTDSEPTPEPIATTPSPTVINPEPPTEKPVAPPSGAAIPEPTTITGLALAGLALTYLRRRKQT